MVGGHRQHMCQQLYQLMTAGAHAGVGERPAEGPCQKGVIFATSYAAANRVAA